MASGIFHNDYLIMLAPTAAALDGPGGMGTGAFYDLAAP